jgi:PAS domain S-box-containing protein
LSTYEVILNTVVNWGSKYFFLNLTIQLEILELSVGKSYRNCYLTNPRFKSSNETELPVKLMSEKINHELEKILEFSQDMICILDAEGVFLRVSTAAVKMLGFQPDDMIGSSYKRFIHPDDISAGLEAIHELVFGSGTCAIENRYRNKEGQYVPLIWSASWDHQENIMHCIARDNTIRKENEQLLHSLKESNLRYSYVSMATSDAIWDWDLISGSLYWGEGFRQIFGYIINQENQDYSSWISHVHPDDLQRVRASIHAVIKGNGVKWEEEYQYQRADGSYAEVVDRGFVIRSEDGRALRMVGSMHDNTERNTSLRALKQSANDLYKRNRELQYFGYIVSHNLRSPVANILGLASVLEVASGDHELIDQCTRNLKSAVTKLDDVIKDLSKILSVNDGSVELISEHVDIAKELSKVTSGLEEQIQVNEATISITGNVRIRSYKAYVYSILLNLISNAIKYRSKAAPFIKISIIESPDGISIDIADNGIGIDIEKHKDDLFKPYKRFDQSQEGKGLGLFLVQSHVKALKGHIHVVSSLGKGTTFKIFLPSSI